MEFYTKIAKYGNYNLIANELISNTINKYGAFSPMEIDFLMTILKKNDVVIELGSHIGSHTIPIAKKIENGMLIAFEPQRLVFQVLCSNLILNNLKNVYTYNYGIGKSNIDLCTETCESDTGGLSLTTLKETNKLENMIKVRKISEFPEINNLQRLDLLFMDVERMEFDVLSEFDCLIKKFLPNIFVEIYIDTFVCVRDLLKKYGYKVYQFIPNNSQYEPDVKTLLFDMPMLFATHPTKNYINSIGLIDVSDADNLDCSSIMLYTK